jgi:hypothetical protein
MRKYFGEEYYLAEKRRSDSIHPFWNWAAAAGVERRVKKAKLVECGGQNKGGRAGAFSCGVYSD